MSKQHSDLTGRNPDSTKAADKKFMGSAAGDVLMSGLERSPRC